MTPMAGRECYHCRQWVEEGEAHDCWTTTEAALTGDLTEDLRDAFERLRETAAAFGDQRIYASHNSIMFSRRSCYFFVRPKRSFLEVCVFLGRTVTAPQIRRADRTSKVKVAHIIQVRHRDEVEPPLTDWLREAYELGDSQARLPVDHGSGARQPTAPGGPSRATKRSAPNAPAPKAIAPTRAVRKTVPGNAERKRVTSKTSAPGKVTVTSPPSNRTPNRASSAKSDPKQAAKKTAASQKVGRTPRTAPPAAKRARKRPAPRRGGG